MKIPPLDIQNKFRLIRKTFLVLCLLAYTDFTSNAQQSLANYFRGLAAIENNNPEAAISFFKNALQDGVKPSIIHSRLGEIYYRSGDFANALKEFEEAELTDPSVNAFNIARCQASLNNPAAMIASLKVAIQSANSVPYYLIQKESAFQSMKSTPEWIQFWNQSQYSASGANLNEAFYLYETRKYEDAVNLINSILEKRPKFAEALFLRGLTWVELGENAFAADDFNAASALKPSNDNYLYCEAKARTSINQFKKALKCVNEAIRLNPYQPEYLYTQSLILFKDNQLEKAAAGVQLYAQYFDYQDKTKLLQAKILIEQNKLEEALEITRQLIKEKQGADEAYFLRGMIYQLTNQYVQAIDDYGMALDINPKDPLSYLNRGNCYLQISLPEKACEDFNKALQLGYKNAYLLIREYCSGKTF